MISPLTRTGVAGLTRPHDGVPATGAAVRLPYSMFYDVSDGKIIALRAYFPITALLHQLREAASAHA
jgi:ketosteroid isomerase-like protein